MLILLQTKQCRQTSLSVHAGRANTFRTDRMLKAAGLTALRGQAFGLLGDYVTLGREPRSLDTGDKLTEEVRSFGSEHIVLPLADLYTVTLTIATSILLASPFVRLETLPPSKCPATSFPKSKRSYPHPTPTFDGKQLFALCGYVVRSQTCRSILWTRRSCC